MCTGTQRLHGIVGRINCVLYTTAGWALCCHLFSFVCATAEYFWFMSQSLKTLVWICDYLRCWNTHSHYFTNIPVHSHICFHETSSPFHLKAILTIESFSSTTDPKKPSRFYLHPPPCAQFHHLVRNRYNHVNPAQVYLQELLIPLRIDFKRRYLKHQLVNQGDWAFGVHMPRLPRNSLLTFTKWQHRKNNVFTIIKGNKWF